MTNYRLPVEFDPADPGMVKTVIITYGSLHGEAPEGTAPVISVDLRTALRNPADDPAMIHMTGLDARVRDHVLSTPGAQEIIADTVGRILAAYAWSGATNRRQDAMIFCRGGRHRSVAIAEAVAARLRSLGHNTEVEHRDITLPVQPPTPRPEG
jgi:RNase adaptor protein for sRNA GlmZ degradation